MQKSSFVRVLVGSSVLVGASSASADFVGASYTSEILNPGEVTYRIYLNYDNPLDKQLAVSGNANFSALQLTASSPLIQKHLVIEVPADVPGDLALPGDSWVTVGEAPADGPETQFSPGFLEGQGDAFGALISGDGFLQADNGGYFDSNPATSVEGGPILIAQFTFIEGTTWTFIGTSDYNANGTDLANAPFFVSNDCDDNGLADIDEIDADPDIDCNANGVLDICESLDDCNGDGVPDVCDVDCNSDGLPDVCQSLPDCNGDGVPDQCQIKGNDCDDNGVLDSCELEGRDCDGDGVLDLCQIQDIPDLDCDLDGVLDSCAQGVCDTDITNDCFVDFADLTQLLANWGPCGANCPPGDFDGDGQIGFLDLVELLFEYGECTK